MFRSLSRTRQGARASALLIPVTLVLMLVLSMIAPGSVTMAAQPVVPSSVTAASASSAAAAVGSNFDPGYIVSDENFFDGYAMNEGEVQSLIISKNSRCSSAYACLWNFRQNTPATSASNYCAAIPAMGATAAGIIAQVGKACNISQKALLVLLEKEQGLVSSSNPSQRSFDAATGFNCPDTAPCDPAFAGFFYQVYNAARQFQIYKAFPASFNHRPNAANSILFNPTRSCGTSSVFIRNVATAGLYNYTPYQPNAAALNNMYGVGDGCSSYGNRNFWRIWSDWFGSPTADRYDLIRPAGTDYTYLVSGSLRFAFMSPDLLAQYTAIGPIREVSLSLFYSRWTDGVRMQRGLRTTDGAVYLIDSNTRYQFSGCAQALDFGLDCNYLPVVAPSQVAKLPNAGYVSSLVGLPDGSMWLMQGGARREVPEPGVLAAYGISPVPTKLSNHSIGSNQIGTPVLTAGLYTNGSGKFRAATGGGQLDVTTAAAAGKLSPTARAIHPYSFDRMIAEGTLPLRMTSDGRYFVAIDGGWMETSAATYGASTFTAMRSGAWIGVPVVLQQPGAHFIKERSSTQVYLISGGMRQRVASVAEQNFISATYGVPNSVWLAADGALEGVGEASNLTSGTVIRAGASSPMFLVDGARLVSVPRLDYARLLGFGASVQTVSASVVNGFADRAAVLDRTIITCGGTSYLGSKGVRHPFAPGAEAAWKLPALALSDATCALIPVSPIAVGQYVVGPDDRRWFVENGQRHQVVNAAARTILAARTPAVALSNETIGQLVGGPDANTGAPQGSTVTASNGKVYVVDGDRLIWLQRWQTSIDLGFGGGEKATNVDAGFMALFPTPDAILDRVAVTCRGTSYLGVGGRLLAYNSKATADGWAQAPVPLSDAACARLTVSSTVVTPFFRTPSGQVWMATGAERRPINGWPAMNRLGVIATGYLDVNDEISRLLPVGAMISE